MSDFPVVLTSAVDTTTEIVAKHLNNLEAKVGIDGSAVTTSLDYLLKNSASIDPGHKHSKLWASDGSPEAVTVDASGNVGIGMTPVAKLDVNGGGQFLGNYSILKVQSAGANEVSATIRNTAGGFYLGVTAAGAPFFALLDGSGNYRSDWWQGSASNGDLYITNKVGIGTTNPTISGVGRLHMSGDTLRLDTARAPASAGAAGNEGEICWDNDHLYVCVATNTWHRVAHATWT